MELVHFEVGGDWSVGLWDDKWYEEPPLTILFSIIFLFGQGKKDAPGIKSLSS